MNKHNFKSLFIVIAMVFLALVIGLWSWNTLADLFGGPHAQFKHAIAVMGLALLTKWAVSTHLRHGDCDVKANYCLRGNHHDSV